ncbi:MAG: hypothetical protein KJ063_09650 [Anaerolineae bacterium]|nr:hypothetical protein [Anaerolineae bacterium]
MARDELTSSTNPYVGPRTFLEEDARLFFGREREARELLSLVISEPLTLFYARSGAGKSSLINTRLIPGLRDEEFFVLPVTRVSGALPAKVTEITNVFAFNLLLNLDPNQAEPQALAQTTLSEYLQRTKEQLPDPTLARVLIIDQFEEIFTTHLDHWQERPAFFEQLAQAMNQDPLLWVLLSMREDYVASLDPFARMLPRRLRPRFFMQRMDAETALIAIEEPARRGGRPFAPGVAETLVNNLRQIHGQTKDEVILGQFVEPVQLQVVCYQLWHNLQARPLAEISYDDVKELGDVDMALGQFYEQAIGRVIKETGVTELTLRNWFENHLITESRTRGTVYQGRETTASLPNEAILLLVNQFLLRSEFRAGGTWFELVHDRFVEPILQANAEWRLRQSPLVQAAAAWERAERPREKLFRGTQLREALQEVNLETCEEPVKSFLQASQDAQNERDLARAQEEAEKEARIAARLRLLAIGLVIAFFLTAAASVIALWQSQAAQVQAAQNATLAIVNEAAAATAGIAAVTSDSFAVEANFLVQTANAAAADAAQAQGTSEAFAQENLDLAATSQAAAFLAATRAAEAEQARQDAEQARLEAEQQRCIVLSQALAAQAILTLSQPQNDTELATLLAVQATNLPCLGETPDIEVRQLSQAVLQDVLTRPYYNNILRRSGSPVRSLTFSRDGQWLAAATDDGIVLVYDLFAPGNDPYQLSQHTGPVRTVAFNPVTIQLASAGDDGLINLWDLANPDQPLLTLAGHAGSVRALVFSPDGTRLFSGGEDRSVRIWELTADEPQRSMMVISEHTNIVFALTYAQGNNQSYLISASAEAVYLWEVSRLPQVRPLRLSSNQRFANDLALNRTGRLLATIGSDASVRLWNLANPASSIPAPSSLTFNVAQLGAVAFSPVGSTLFVGDSTGTIRLWEVPAFTTDLGQARATLLGPQAAILGLTVSPDGQFLASAAASGEIRLWQLSAATGGVEDAEYEILLEQACKEVSRNLSAEEWENYLPGQVYIPTCVDLPINNR